MKNTGKDYERFVASIYEAIINAEKILDVQNIKIELNKKITDNFGIHREFDIYWKFKMFDIDYETIIECKDYKNKVSIDKIDGIIGKIKDMPTKLIAIFATTQGYQKGAKEKAQKNGIELLIIREQKESDWYAKDGTPYIKDVNIRLTIDSPARITYFDPIPDYEWVKDNTDIKNGDVVECYNQNDKIFINDLTKNQKYSLYDLANKLTPTGDEKYGSFKEIVNLENAFLETQDFKLKILGYNIEYYIAKPFISNNKIDLSANIIGIIENIQKGTKQTILKNGNIQTE
jgi:hypothetical protein